MGTLLIFLILLTLFVLYYLYLGYRNNHSLPKNYKPCDPDTIRMPE